MAILTLNDKQYDIEKLSPEAQAKLNSARFCEQKIESLEAELAIIKTARSTYLQALPELVSDSALVAPIEKTVTRKPAVKKASTKPAEKAKKTPAKKATTRKTAAKKSTTAE